MMLSRKNIPNGLRRAVYGGKPHNVPKALQSVNMKNTSEERREGAREGGAACGGVHALKCRHVANTSHFAISVPVMSASMNDAGQRSEPRCFLFGRTKPNSSERKFHICLKIIIGFKFASDADVESLHLQGSFFSNER